MHSYLQRIKDDLYVCSLRRCHSSTYLVSNRLECELQKTKDDKDNVKHPDTIVKCVLFKWGSEWRLKTIQISKKLKRKVKRTITNPKNRILEKETLGQTTFNSSAYFVLFVEEENNLFLVVAISFIHGINGNLFWRCLSQISCDQIMKNCSQKVKWIKLCALCISCWTEWEII